MLCASCHQKYDMTEQFKEKAGKRLKTYYKTHKHPMLGRRHKQSSKIKMSMTKTRKNKIIKC